MKRLKNYRFAIILLFSIALGGTLGIFLQEDATVLKPIGDIFLNLMFTVVVPLIFFTIASSISNMEGAKRLGNIMKSMLTAFLFTGLVAALFMLVVVKVFDPAAGVDIHLVKPDATEEISVAEQIVKTVTVSDFSELLSRNNMLALIILTVLVGFATQSLGERGKPFAAFLSSGSEVMMKLVSYVMYLAPVGLGAYFATLVGEYGPLLLGSYIKAGATYYIAAFVYFFAAFTLFAYLAGKGLGVKVFWKNMFTPSITALATCSSAASIPANFEATQKMGVSKDIRDTTIPLGSALHKDGSVMGGVLKIAFVFGVFGMDFTGINTYLLVIGVALLVGIVMGAIPSGGMIGEMLILSLFGLPPEALPIIAAISTLIDPPATLLNAAGDNVTSMMVSRWVEGKNWLKNKIA